MPTCSLVISTYNWPDALRLCLLSVMEQTILPDEIVICDDGSGSETNRLIEGFKLLFKIPILHVWQPDEGFQLARIRNKGFAAANGDYLIQIDGDLILHKNFVKDHLHFCQTNCFATGSRVLLSQETTSALIKQESIAIATYEANSRNFFNRLRIPALHGLLAERYKNKGKHKYYVKGCNMAFWKSDILKVNGYNESFTGWGREDSELAIRLINAGVKKRFLKFGGISFHLFHAEASREMEQKNIDLMKRAIAEKIIRTSDGIDYYLKPAQHER
jgi:glycosyltransferase involved in cell wall biosynthesis